jgi:hypothetical protein
MKKKEEPLSLPSLCEIAARITKREFVSERSEEREVMKEADGYVRCDIDDISRRRERQGWRGEEGEVGR